MVRPSSFFVRPEPYLSTCWSDLMHSWYKQLVPWTLDIICFVKIYPFKFLCYCPCLSVGNYNVKLILAFLCNELHISQSYYILRKTIEGYLDSVPSLTSNTIKTLLIMHVFHSTKYLQSKWMIYISHASMVSVQCKSKWFNPL